MEGSHVQLGVELARKYNETPDVIHAIEAHHNDVEPQHRHCLPRAGGRRHLGRSSRRTPRERGELYPPSGKARGADRHLTPVSRSPTPFRPGREVRIMVKPEDVSEDNMIILARELTKKIESELEYPGQIKVNVIRETKVVEYAK